MPAAQEFGWKVTSQREITAPDATGNYVDGIQISFTTVQGTAASVFVPNNLYTVDNAKRIIGERAAVVDGVANLTSD